LEPQGQSQLESESRTTAALKGNGFSRAAKIRKIGVLRRPRKNALSVSGYSFYRDLLNFMSMLGDDRE
jgi:hypothetical protein